MEKYIAAHGKGEKIDVPRLVLNGIFIEELEN
jgi:hypothetical protein